MLRLARLAGRLPLPLLHAIGAVGGWLAYFASPRYAARLRDNVSASGVAPDRAAARQLRFSTISEAGKAALELFAIWFRPYPDVLRLVRSVEGWAHVEAAMAKGQGAMLITPHVGCFEIGGLYCGSRLRFTELYRPPRLAWLEPWMREGRMRGHVTLAATDLAGVRKLLAALKRGEAIGALPDQVPSQGEGAWAEFFGRPAYTMSLLARLQAKTGAPIVFFYARRLRWGRGYAIRFLPAIEQLPDDPSAAARIINQAVETIVRACPAQYLWSYNRYKTPAGVRREG